MQQFEIPGDFYEFLNVLLVFLQQSLCPPICASVSALFGCFTGE
jgi:hypothetical protein